MSYSKEFNIPWYYRLRFRALALFIALSILITAITGTVMEVISAKITEQLAHEQLSHSRQKVLTELYKRTEMATTLVDTLSTLSSQLSNDYKTLKQLAPELMQHRDSNLIIAGGGIWPEPYAFDKSKRRNSYFWGRNPESNNEFTFFNGYNEDSNGYHQEEWYIPSRYLGEKAFYWSKSYTDIHSNEPMVTVSTSIYRKQQYIGAATIDLKLQGLKSVLKESTAHFNGYAFAVDRNGRLLSYPERLNKHSKKSTEHENHTLPAPQIKTLKELVNQQTYLSDIYNALTKEYEPLNLNRQKNRITSLSQQLLNDSPHITQDEATRIAINILNQRAPSSPRISKEKIFNINYDNMLKGGALAIITVMPTTDWRIVTVMPKSSVETSTARFINILSGSFIITLLCLMFFIWYLLQKIYTTPLDNITKQLKEQTDKNSNYENIIYTDDKGELGALTFWFNQRTSELLSSKKTVKSLEFFDALTGLPNRKMLNEHLTEKLTYAKRANTSGAVIILDIDHFKNFNDSLGHDFGDQLLIEFGKRLTACLRKDDFIARLGGDEFIIILSQHTPNEKDEARVPGIIAKKIIASMTEPFLLNDALHHITSSIGIALFNKHNKDIGDILKYADSAMYQSKSNGRNTFCFFEQQMQTKIEERLSIESDLRKAIDNDELSLAFQPQITIKNTCASVEALVRWNHPTKGYIAPVRFIRIAEESTLILALGSWVLENTCQQIKQWESEGIFFDHIAINISPIQFQQSHFVENTVRTILENNISPKCIMIEITEGVIIENSDNVIDKILQLKETGIRVSIDDFGTGYSSLTYLKRLPLDELKIDRSFVKEIECDNSDAVITETIIAMAQKFDYEVIAEGVETQKQQDILAAKGCKLFQGYLFSKPLASDDIPDYLANLQKSLEISDKHP